MAASTVLPVPIRLLKECRDLAAQRLTQALPRLMDQVDDALFDLGNKGENTQVQSLYFDAMREVRLRRPRIESDFRAKLMALVNPVLREALARARGPARSPEVFPAPGAGRDPEPGGFLLVEDDDLEESLAVTHMSQKIRTACGQHLYLLDRRVGLLLDKGEIDGADNPLGPEMICQAFRETYQCIEAGIEVKLLVLKLFDRFLVAEMEPLYSELNAHLAKRNVLPNLRPSIRRQSGPGLGAGVAPAGADAARSDEGADRGAPGSARPALAPGRIQSVLANAGTPAAAGGALGGGAVRAETGRLLLQALESWMRLGEGRAPAGMASDPSAAGGKAGGFLAHLTSLQADPYWQQSFLGGGRTHAGGEEPDDSGGEGARADLRVLKLVLQEAADNEPGASGGARPLAPGDEMLIDIVAMMFDYILDDDTLAPTMKALISRLQIPVLKVAVIDKSLFARRFHPARQLLNLVAETAVGWTESDPLGQELRETLEHLVDRIVDEFDADVALFSEVLEALRAYLAEEEAERANRVNRSAAVMTRRARLEAAKRAVHLAVEAVTGRGSLPDIVARFFRQHWAGLLVITHVREGEESAAYAQMVTTMDDIAALFHGTFEPDRRETLIARVPLLMKRVNEALKRLEIPDSEREVLRATLAERYAELVRNAGGAGSPARDEHVGAAAGEGESSGASGPGAGLEAPATVGDLLLEAVSRANREIYDAGRGDRKLAGMGTTVVAAILRDDRVSFAHVGDSRLYRWRAGLLTPLTRDHSLVQELIDKGFYTAEEAAAQVSKNIVTRGLGIDASVDVDLGCSRAEPGDVYLLCSDGLTDMVDDLQISAAMRRHVDDLPGLSARLVRMANESGGRDNISVIVAAVDKPFPAQRRWYKSKSLRGKVRFDGRTDVGRRREHNEDGIAFDADRGITVLADGMGGQQAGDVACALAIKRVMEDLEAGVRRLDPTTDTPALEVAAVREEEATPASATEVGAAADGPPGAENEAEIRARMLELLGHAEGEIESVVIDNPTFADEEACASQEVGATEALSGELAEALDAEVQGQLGAGDRAEEDDLGILSLPRAASTATPEGDGSCEPGSSIVVGAWVQLADKQGRRVKARLSWVNQTTGAHLFTDRRGTKVAEWTARGLNKALSDGSARLLPTDAIPDRALTSLFAQLRQKEAANG